MHKTKSLLLSLLLSLGIGSVASTQAAVITFDDLPAAEFDVISDGYQGFNWGVGILSFNVSYIHKDTIPEGGFLNGIVSGDYAAYNTAATTSTISSNDIFDFNGAYFASGWSEGMSIEITGLLNNVALFTKTVIVSTQQSQWFDFDFIGINSLTLFASGGTPIDPNLAAGNDYFVMDNFTVNETASVPVPESSSLALLFLGLAALVISRKKAIKKH